MKKFIHETLIFCLYYYSNLRQFQRVPLLLLVELIYSYNII